MVPAPGERIRRGLAEPLAAQPGPLVGDELAVEPGRAFGLHLSLDRQERQHGNTRGWRVHPRVTLSTRSVNSSGGTVNLTKAGRS